MSSQDPAIWSKLPCEIIFNIIDHLPKSDLISWSRVSRYFSQYATAQLWQTIKIQASAIELYRLLLRTQEDIASRMALENNFLQYLTQSTQRPDTSSAVMPQGLQDWYIPMHLNPPKRENPMETGPPRIPAKPLRSLVKHLQISDRAESTNSRVGPLTHLTSSSGYVLSQIFNRLNGLRKLSCDGRLSTTTLLVITEIPLLTSLSLRVGSEQHSLRANARTSRGPWTVKKVDFGELGRLRHLQNLSIGHLGNWEVEGLAHSVMSLKLRELRISTKGWLIWQGHRPSVARQFGVHSPLVGFLHALATLPLVDDQQPRGFPSTLRYLALTDRYYPRTPSLHQHLVSLIAHCERLDDIELGLLISGTDTKRESFDSLNIPSHDITVGVQSWDQLSRSTEVPIAYNYWCPKSTGNDRTEFERFRLPRGDSGRIINMARVLDEIIAKHFEYESAHPQQTGQYLRTMKFSREAHRSLFTFQDGVVEVHWIEASLVSSGDLSVQNYLRHIGFRKGPVEQSKFIGPKKGLRSEISG